MLPISGEIHVSLQMVMAMSIEVAFFSLDFATHPDVASAARDRISAPLLTLCSDVIAGCNFEVSPGTVMVANGCVSICETQVVSLKACLRWFLAFGAQAIGVPTTVLCSDRPPNLG